jgi:hypothetical protein
MASRPGRNQPCPCGSGRKYKNCCLAADEAAERAERAAALEAAPFPAPPVASPFLGDEPLLLPPAFDDEDDFEDDLDAFEEGETLDPAALARWKAFAEADLDTQIAAFEGALESGELDDDESYAFEMLTAICDQAKRHGELPRATALIDRLKRDAPEAYADNASHYARWFVDDALARGEPGLLAAALDPIGRDLAEGISVLFAVAEQLLYYGHYEALTDMMVDAWCEIEDSDDFDPTEATAYRGLLTALLLLRYVTTAPQPHADDPALCDQSAPYLDAAGIAEYQEQAAAMLGTLGHTWRPRDFEVGGGKWPRERRVYLLAWEWLGDVWRRQQAPLGRALLATTAILQFQREQKLRGKSAAQILVPARKRLDSFLAGYLTLLSWREHWVGATVELLPLYLYFLAERGLVPPDTARRALHDLRPVQQDTLLALRAGDAEPAIIEAITTAWAAR